MNSNLEIRLERARSWLILADSLTKRLETMGQRVSPGVGEAREHEQFIFYWIAFNCLYGRSPYDTRMVDERRTKQKGSEGADPELESFIKNVKTMTHHDWEKRTLNGAITRCGDIGKTVILDYFLDHRYWEKKLYLDDVKQKCKEEWEQVKEELAASKNDKFLKYSLRRLKVLRNQIMHGSVTYGGKSKGLESLLPGLELISILVPAFYDLTKDYGHCIDEWDAAPYPRRLYPGHPWPPTITVRK